MNIGFGQILIIIFVGILLFGNFPSLLKDLAIGIKNFRETLKLPDKESHKDNISDKDRNK
jgi:Sec-independent protein translocase protein TatA